MTSISTDIDDTTTLWGSLYLWLHRKSGKDDTTSVSGTGGNVYSFD